MQAAGTLLCLLGGGVPLLYGGDFRLEIIAATPSLGTAAFGGFRETLSINDNGRVFFIETTPGRVGIRSRDTPWLSGGASASEVQRLDSTGGQILSPSLNNMDYGAAYKYRAASVSEPETFLLMRYFDGRAIPITEKGNPVPDGPTAVPLRDQHVFEIANHPSFNNQGQVAFHAEIALRGTGSFGGGIIGAAVFLWDAVRLERIVPSVERSLSPGALVLADTGRLLVHEEGGDRFTIHERANLPSSSRPNRWDSQIGGGSKDDRRRTLIAFAGELHDRCNELTASQPKQYLPLTLGREFCRSWRLGRMDHSTPRRKGRKRATGSGRPS
jgi:hypothetical protein